MAKKNRIWMWIIAIIIVALLYNNNSLSFYKHRECFVSEDMMGCEATGGAETITYNANTCVSFMESKGCQPENCYYYGDAECGITYDSKDMVKQECYTTEECLDRFQNTGYWCFKDHLSPKDDKGVIVGFCKFEGNHWPEGRAVMTFGLEDFSFDDFVENNKFIFIILGSVLLVWLMIFVFTPEKPGFVVK